RIYSSRDRDVTNKFGAYVVIFRRSSHVALRRPERMKSSVRSPAFRPQASNADPFRDAKRLRPKGGTTNRFSACGTMNNARPQDSTEAVADAIYTNGEVITVNDARPSAEAVAVKDGKILAVGARDDVMRYQGPSTEVVDLKGRTMVPGFV